MKNKKILFEKTRKKSIPKGEFSIKLMDEIFRDVFYNNDNEPKRWQNMNWTPKHYVYTEDGVQYSIWQVGPIFTGNVGMELLHEAIKKSFLEDEK